MKDFLANLLFYLNIYTATETTRKDGVCKNRVAFNLFYCKMFFGTPATICVIILL